jgi:hypothetical protein
MRREALRPGGLLPVILAIVRLDERGRATPSSFLDGSDLIKLDGCVHVVRAWAGCPSKVS